MVRSLPRIAPERRKMYAKAYIFDPKTGRFEHVAEANRGRLMHKWYKAWVAGAAEGA